MYHPISAGIDQFLAARNESREWPLLAAESQFNESENQLALSLLIPSDLRYFDGHFPGQAVVPGVVQIHWAGELAKQAFGVAGFHCLQGAKFNRMVLPNSPLNLSLQFSLAKQRVSYAYHCGEEKCSVGSLTFQQVAA